MPWLHTAKTGTPFLIFTSRMGSQLGSKRPGNFDISYPSPENAIVVSPIASTLSTETISPSLLTRSLPVPMAEKHLRVKKKLATPDVDHFKNELHAEGISKESALIITNSQRLGTNSRYEST